MTTIRLEVSTNETTLESVYVHALDVEKSPLDELLFALEAVSTLYKKEGVLYIGMYIEEDG